MSDQELGIFQTLKSGSQFHVFSQIPQNKIWIESVWIEKNHYENEVNRVSAGQTKRCPQIKATDSFTYIHTKGWNIENSFWGKAKNVELQETKAYKACRWHFSLMWIPTYDHGKKGKELQQSSKTSWKQMLNFMSPWIHIVSQN